MYSSFMHLLWLDQPSNNHCMLSTFLLLKYNYFLSGEQIVCHCAFDKEACIKFEYITKVVYCASIFYHIPFFFYHITYISRKRKPLSWENRDSWQVCYCQPFRNMNRICCNIYFVLYQGATRIFCTTCPTAQVASQINGPNTELYVFSGK